MAGLSAVSGRNLAILLAFALLSGALFLPLPLNHDAAWHLITAFKWLDGARVGYEVFDINPPMTATWSSIPALIVNVTGFDAMVTFKLFTLAILAACFAATLSLSGYVAKDPAGQRVFVFYAGLALFLLPGYDFAQREHLTAALCLPYVLLTCGRAAGEKPPVIGALLAGLAAGIGIGIKPYFALLPIIIEILLWIDLRRLRNLLRPESVAIGAVGIAYLVAVQIFAPGYYTVVLKAALSNYGGFEVAWTTFWSRTTSYLALSIIVIAALLLAGPKRRWLAEPAMRYLAAAALAFLLAAALQRKGWNYQLFPVAFYLTLLTATILGHIVGSRPWLNARMVAIVGLTFLSGAMVPLAYDMLSASGTRARVNRLAAIFATHAGLNGLVFGFVTSPRDVHPAVLQSRTSWAGSSGVLVYLPAYLKIIDDPGDDFHAKQVQAVAEAYDRLMLEQLLVSQPKVIVSQFGPKRLGIEGMDLLYETYFSRYPAFRLFWQDYELLETVGPFRVFARRM